MDGVACRSSTLVSDLQVLDRRVSRQLLMRAVRLCALISDSHRLLLHRGFRFVVVSIALAVSVSDSLASASQFLIRGGLQNAASES